MIKTFERIAGALVLIAFTLLAYEAYAIGRARARTPDVLVRAAAGELRLSDFSPARRRALILVEDPGFSDHRGVDFKTPGQGRTSLTQSLVKIFYFDRFEPGFAKIEQSLIARFVLDAAMSKPAQIEAFINHARLGTWRGRQVTGFADAARIWFGHSFADLSDQEYLALVAMLIAPNRLDPRHYPRENAERVRRIERLLAGRCRPAGLDDVYYERC